MNSKKSNLGRDIIITLLVVAVEIAISVFLFWKFKTRFYLHSSFTPMLIGVMIAILAAEHHMWYDPYGKYNKLSIVLYGISAVIITITVVSWLLSSPIFRAKEYYFFVDKMITIIEDDEETSAFPNLLGETNDTANLPLIGEPEAIKRAQTEMGRFPALGSQFELKNEDLTSQNVNGNLTYVIPLQPKSWMKWNSDGNHGYFIIDRNNSNTEFIDTSLHTTTRAPFEDNARRIINNYLNREKIEGVVTDISPEIDDDGVFHYVATVYIIHGMDGFDEVTGIVDLNGQTKECKYYSLKEIPDYIDRVYPESFFEAYLSYYGKYKNGWLNSWTSQKEVQKTTSGMDVIYIDGTCYYYTGWCSTSEESSNGIMMMNSRTGEIQYHKTYGISESRAQGVLQGLVADKGYKASYPLLLQIAGTETYFSLMRDDSNNHVGYGFVSYKDYSKAAVEASLLDAQTAYMATLMKSNSATSFDESSFDKVSSVITAITNEVIDGNTFYYVQVQNSDKIFQMRSNLDLQIVFAEIGDKISIEYYDSGSIVETAIGCEIKRSN